VSNKWEECPAILPVQASVPSLTGLKSDLCLPDTYVPGFPVSPLRGWIRRPGFDSYLALLFQALGIAKQTRLTFRNICR
jgi:hypothetical protein